MRDEFSGLEFAIYLRQRVLVVAVCGGVALAAAGAISLLTTPRYTATASLLIEPPAGNDPRASTAVSPVYLESLKTYERLALSDSLFSRALDDLHLRQRYPAADLESLKRRMLSVSKPTSTTILEISATLDNPREAQALAQYVAEHTVELNLSLDQKSSEELTVEPQRIHTAARDRRQKAEQAQIAFLKSTSVETLEDEVSTAIDLRTEVGRDLAKARASLADYVGQQQAPAPIDPTERQSGWIGFEISATRSRIRDLESQDQKLLQYIDDKGPALEKLKRAQETIDVEVRAARAEDEAAKTKLSDIRGGAGFRGVKLKVADPGVVPQRPSSPNVPLNLAVALALSVLASVAYLAVRFAYERVQSQRPDPVYSRI